MRCFECGMLGDNGLNGIRLSREQELRLVKKIIPISEQVEIVHTGMSYLVPDRERKPGEDYFDLDNIFLIKHAGIAKMPNGAVCIVAPQEEDERTLVLWRLPRNKISSTPLANEATTIVISERGRKELAVLAILKVGGELMVEFKDGRTDRLKYDGIKVKVELKVETDKGEAL